MAVELVELRGRCLARGASGIHDIGRALRNNDDDGSKSLSLAEFKDGLKNFGLSLQESSVQEMFTHIDKDGSGTIRFDEFLQAIRPAMSQTRISIIDEAFNKFDTNGDGVISVADLKDVYNAKHHHKYRSGVMTEDEAFREIFDVFKHGVKDGKVTKEEFINYYSGVSAFVKTDQYFDEDFVEMMKSAWKM